MNVGVGNVTFEPGCRNNWHIHRDGFQLLLITGGEGWYQEEGKPAQFLKAGDVIVTHDGVKHWHGAAKKQRKVRFKPSHWLKPKRFTSEKEDKGTFSVASRYTKGPFI